MSQLTVRTTATLSRAYSTSLQGAYICRSLQTVQILAASSRRLNVTEAQMHRRSQHWCVDGLLLVAAATTLN